jgi:exodeoxyribonuclease VII large subunit
MPSITPKVLTVTDLTRRIKDTLEQSFPSVWIEGEISNLRQPASGHVYFTLKDAGAQINSVAFRSAASHLRFKLKDGLAVVVHGDISVYEKSGQYQVIVRQIQPKGLGVLQQAFEELKQRLSREGLFDQARKKPLPALPTRIGLITSPTGAAIRDFLNIIGRRFPNIHIVINPVRVQGQGAAEEIASAVDEFNALRERRQLAMDVIIVTRGGGSLEDLWAFNEEVVARAIARSQIPVISAVGHEIDFTISDFVADLRAPTPSAAAELVIRSKQQFVDLLAQTQRRLSQDLQLRFSQARQRLTVLAGSHVFRQPADLVRQHAQQVDDLQRRLLQAADELTGSQRNRLNMAAEKLKLLTPQACLQRSAVRLETQARRLRDIAPRYLQLAGQHLRTVAGRLDLLSPRSTLSRGYSITRLTDTGKVVRRVTDVTTGSTMSTIVLDGEIASVVTSALRLNETKEENS